MVKKIKFNAEMIKEEQKDLADYVKNVHLSLRRKSQQIGAEQAWKEHLQNEEVLKNYALAMKSLAENYWSVNNYCGDSKSFLCRIQWTVNYIIEYFQNGVFEKEVEKERKKLELYLTQKIVDSGEVALSDESHPKFSNQSTFKLLDVGSCYNPFGKFSFLEVYPIDLFPADSTVKKCNFLEVDVIDLYEKDWFQDNLQQLPANYFDVVVFSLFLEYLPSPKQRYQACLKAYLALKVHGILVIITPDSKHATANAPLMKNWKIAGAKIGFVRTKVEKLKYLYCMAFRKSASRIYPLLLNKLKDDNVLAEKMFTIPQDYVNYEVKEKEEKSPIEDVDKSEAFEELPFS